LVKPLSAIEQRLRGLHRDQRSYDLRGTHSPHATAKSRLRFALEISSKTDPGKDTLTLIDLLEKGRTFSYEELPDQLWATTGIKIDNITQYRLFGRLRNQIVHFSIANSKGLNKITVLFSLELLDPLVEIFWGKSVIDFIKNDPHDPYATFFYSGLLEDTIREVCVIDQRLRRLLGESSLKAWEKMHDNFEIEDSLFKSKTIEEFEAEYETWAASENYNELQEEHYEQQQMARDKWIGFLDSF
jgi:hypothetical protein